MTTEPVLIHATAVELGGFGLLLRGKPGCGKSDLALRLIEQGAVLISDDQVELRTEDGQLTATPPQTIEGLIEIRGLGLFRVPFRSGARVSLIVDLVPEAEVDRLPEPATETFLGHGVPLIKLAAFHASTPAKLRFWIASLSGSTPIVGADQPGLTPIRKIRL